VILVILLLREDLGFGYSIIQFAGLGLIIFGGIFSMAARFNLRKSYHYLPQAKELVTDGLFRWFRNPVYIGNLSFLLGLALFFGSLFGLAVIFAVMVPIHLFRARYEGQILHRTFGKEYEDYRKKTIF
jgi:protein-S-isoprenylcysteine O-methyltransferase Ste14